MSDTDPVRRRIVAAMDEVLAGDPASWTVSELSRRARLGRHLITQKHTDLRDRFVDRRNALSALTDDATQEANAEIEKLDNAIAELRAQVEEGRATISGISRTVQTIFLENGRLRDESHRLRREIERLQTRTADTDTVVTLHGI